VRVNAIVTGNEIAIPATPGLFIYCRQKQMTYSKSG
jgi:hypothetical protein